MTPFWLGVLVGASGVAALLLIVFWTAFAVMWWATRRQPDKPPRERHGACVMNYSGKYKVTEVRERENQGKSRYVVLTPQDHLSGRTADGCLELLVTDELLVLEFAINSVHTVSVSPQSPAVRAAVPAGPIVDGNPELRRGENVSGLVVETDAEADARKVREADARQQARVDEANAANRTVKRG